MKQAFEIDNGGIIIAKFEFYLSNDDTERLFAIKENKGRNDLTGNEFAKELLESVLYKMHPRTVKYDDNGNRIKN